MESCEVLLPAGSHVRHPAPGNFLSWETERIDLPGGPMPFAKGDLEGSCSVEFGATESRVLRLVGAACGRPVEVDMSVAPYFTLWSKLPDDFIRSEPRGGLPDQHERRPFEEKLAIQEIPPEGELRKSFAIRLPEP